jgi:hypothetical protein
MKPTTADYLLKVLSDMAKEIENCQVRIKAFETALQKYEPNLYQCYQNAVGRETQAIANCVQPQPEPLNTAILRTMLVQDQD